MPAERTIFLPGMGADHRLFGPQRAAGIPFEVPELPIPRPDEGLPAYAARLAAKLDLSTPCTIVGTSFGGMLACELAAATPCRQVVLIASCRHREAVSRAAWPIEWAARFLPDAVIRHQSANTARLLARIESLPRDQYALVRDMALEIPVPYLRRVGRMILKWKRPSPLTCPIAHIHGDRDRLIPLRNVQPDEVVPGGGHLINLTHPDQVNRFLRQYM
jgi:pimeloyl-ACP methyl ester carboxylesterase